MSKSTTNSTNGRLDGANIVVTDTTNNGYLQLPAQTATPATSPSCNRIFTLPNNNLSWINPSGIVTSFAPSTSNVTVSFPASGAIPTTDNAATLINKSISSANNTISIVSADLRDTISVSKGGTGQSSLLAGQLLLGNGTSAVTGKIAPSGDIVGTTDSQTLSNKSIYSAAGNIVEATSLRKVQLDATPPTNNMVLIANGNSGSSWGLIGDANINNVITAIHGGTGRNTLDSGNFLIGAGTSAVTTTKVAPSGAVVGTTDTQTLSGKTLLAATNTIEATILSGRALPAASPAANQVLVNLPNGLAWTAVTDDMVSGVAKVVHGGTGVASIPTGALLVGNGTSAITTRTAPNSEIIGASDSQTLSNKTIDGLANTVNIYDANINNAITAGHGGTGRSTLDSGNFLIGAGTSAVTTTKVAPSGDVVGTTDTQTLSGKTISGTANSLFVYNANLAEVVLPSLGGTGVANLAAGNFLIGAGTSAVTTTKVAPGGAVVGTTDAQTLTGKTISGANNALTVFDANIADILSVQHGGSGRSSLTSGRFLAGAGTTAVDLTKIVPSGDVVGTIDAQTLANKTLSSITNSIDATQLRTIPVDTTAPNIGDVLIAKSTANSTILSWGKIDIAATTGILTAGRGGTGRSTLDSGNFLIGAGTSAVTTTKVAPSGDVVGTTDTQTLSGKTISGTANSLSIYNANLAEIITTGRGGTGRNTLDSGNFLIGAGTGAVTTTKVVPGGAVVGTTDTQTLSGKTLLNTAQNIVDATLIYGVPVDSTAPLLNNVLIATGTGQTLSATWKALDAGYISGILPVANGGTGSSSFPNNSLLVGNGMGAITSRTAPISALVGISDSQTLSNKTIDGLANTVTVYDANINNVITAIHGGTGRNTLTAGNFLIGAGTSAVTTTKVAPSGDVVGTTDTQTLSNKTLLSTAGNILDASQLRTIAIGTAAPTIGQALISTSSTAATWTTITDNIISGAVSVIHGGTGQTSLTTGNFLIGAGTSAVASSKVAPVGDVVGTTDTQILSGKTLLSTAGNIVDATQLRTITIGTTAPTIGQTLISTSSTAATWTTITDTVISGAISVAHGGTGQGILATGKFLVGAGTSAVTTSKVAPSGDVVGTTDTQTLSGKTIDGTANILSVYDANINNVITAGHGGTGRNTLDSGNFLIGAGTSAVTTVKVAPGGDVVGTTDTQTLSGKTLLSTANNIVDATQLRTVAIGTTAPKIGQILVAAVPASDNITATSLIWQDPPVQETVASVARGGTGNSSLTAGNFLIGAGTGAVTTTKVAPSGAVVGTTDTQTLTGKTISGANNVLSIYNTNLTETIDVAHGGTGKTTLPSGYFVTGNGTNAANTTVAVPSGAVVGTTDTQTLTGKTISSANNTITITPTNIIGAIDAAHGGTGQTSLTTGNFLIGAGTSAVTTTKVAPGGDVVGTTDPQTLSGKTIDGTANSLAIYDANISNTISIAHGGTGRTILDSGYFVVGAGTTAATTTKIVPGGAVVGTTDTQILSGKTLLSTAGNIVDATQLRTIAIGTAAPTIGQALISTSSTAASWTTITDTVISGAVSVAHGGTGQTSLTTGNFLVGAGTSAVLTTKVAPSGDVIGSIDSQTLTNKTISGVTNTLNIYPANIIGAIDVTHGGTGQTSLSTGNFLIGAGTSVVTTTKVAPSGDVVGTTDTQSLSNKTIDGTLNTLTVYDANISGGINVIHGGTGQTSLSIGNFLIGAGTSAVTTTKVAPSGAVVGTTDTQTLSGKTLLSTAGNIVDATQLRTISIGTTAPAIGQALISTSSTAATWTSITDTVISGAVSVLHGGTGQTSLTTGNFLVGAGTSAVATTKIAPSGDVVGTTDTQTLTGKTISGANNTLSVLPANIVGAIDVIHGGTGQTSLSTGNFLIGAGTSAVTTTKVAPSGEVVGTTDTQTLTGKILSSTTNSVDASQLRTVSIGTTAPTIGQALISTSSTAATWTTITDTVISGAVSVIHGGTGQTSLSTGNFLIGAGTGVVTTTKVAPSGDVVGTTDTQTLSGKTLSSTANNIVDATQLRTITIGTTAPTIGQALISTSSTAATWTTITDNVISGAVNVAHGGTGQTSLTTGNFLIGAGTSAITTTKVAPSGDVVGTTDTQTLTGKTISGANNTLSILPSNIVGAIDVIHGGTGQTSLTTGNFLVGAGTATVTTTKVAPIGDVVGTTDTQALTNKTLLSTAGNILDASQLRTVSIGTTAPTIGQALISTSSTAASWTTITDNVISGAIGVIHGGTGQTSLTTGNFLIGAGTATVTTAKVAPTGDVVGTTDTQTLSNKTLSSTAGNILDASQLRTIAIGSTAPTIGQALISTSSTAATWTTITDTVISGAIGVIHGGTGQTSLTTGNFLIGAGTGVVTTTKVSPSGDVVGTTDTQTLSGKTISGANNTLSVLPANIVGAIDVIHGGTGQTSLTTGNFLVGAGTSTVTTTKIVPGGDVVGTTDTQILSNKTLLSTAGNIVDATQLRTVSIGTAAPTIGQALISTSSTAATWTSITDNVISGAISAVHGGTGQTSLTAGNFLVGAGTSAVATTKVAPTGDVVGTTDTQVLTNKTLSSAANNLDASQLRTIAIGTAAPTIGQALISTSSTAATWTTITDTVISGAISVVHGGTGQTSLTAGNFLIGAGTSTVATTKVAPSGIVVGTTDTQALTNKTLLSTAGNILDATQLQTISIGTAAPTIGQALISTSSTAATWTTITDTVISGAISVVHGGTGQTSLTAGNFLIGAGTATVTTVKVAPNGDVVGTTDTQTLSGKTMGSATNNLDASQLRTISIGTTAPTIGQALISTSSTAATWTSITDTVISGAVSVIHGGTGQTSLTAGNFLVGAGTATVTTTKVAPTGDVVGTTDTQTLTNKTMGSATNNLDASQLRTIAIGTAAPTIGQALISTSSTAATWTTITDNVISGAVSVIHGGTGQTSLSTGNFLIGAGTGAVTTTKVAPSGDVVGTTDTQSLTNKTMGSATNNLDASQLRTVSIGTTAPTIGQALISTSSTAATWTSITDTVISGAISVVHGGTGQTSLTTGNFLIGAGTGAVMTTKVAPIGDVVGTTDTQILGGKTLLSTAGNIVDATQLRTIAIGTTAPTIGQALIGTSSTAATWTTITDTVISGAVSVVHGGTGQTSLTTGNFLVGAGTATVTTAKVAPSGAVVGTTDTQTLSNKTLLSTAGNILDATQLQTISIGTTAPTIGQALISTSSTAATWTTITDTVISGAINVIHGGTGQTSLTTGNFLIGAGTATITTTKVAPSGAVVGTTDTQTLSSKTLLSTAGNIVDATQLRTIAIGTTAPTIGQALISTSSTAATWTSITDTVISGAISVIHGGTGQTSLSTGNFLIGAGTSTVTTTKVAPSGDVIGTTDTQTLTNKTIGSATNSVDATLLRTIPITTAAPTDGQLLCYNAAGTNMIWSQPFHLFYEVTIGNGTARPAVTCATKNTWYSLDSTTLSTGASGPYYNFTNSSSFANSYFDTSSTYAGRIRFTGANTTTFRLCGYICGAVSNFADTWFLSMMTNGTQASAGAGVEHTWVANGRYSTIGFSRMLTMAQNDVISICVRDSTTANTTFTLQYMIFSVESIGLE